MPAVLQDRVSHELCGCGRAGSGKFGSLCTEPSASDQVSSSPVGITEGYWSFHQLRCCTDVAQTLSSSAFHRRARPEAETSRGRKVELLSEGYRSVPETADVSSTGNVLPSPASKELKGLSAAERDLGPAPGVPAVEIREQPGPTGPALPPPPSMSPLPCAKVPGQAEPAVARDPPSALGSPLAPVCPSSPGESRVGMLPSSQQSPQAHTGGILSSKRCRVFPSRSPALGAGCVSPNFCLVPSVRGFFWYSQPGAV